ncbi:MAG: hypothetical protein P9L99_20320 [Candidatus Lernaella stagnicola]|nr:hypothetical protein [Candidatus Lernaella stagnicola]
MSRRARITLLCLLVALVVFGRLLLLYYSEYVYDEEEYKTGSIAALIMDGPKLPLLEYQPGDYEGGTLLFGLLTVPFFALFGKTYFALKLLALTTSLFMAIFAAWFAARHGGTPAAVATGVLFVLPPAYVAQVGLLPWGNYAENATLSLGMLVAASYLFAAKRPRLWQYFLFGAVLGLGVWIHYGFLVTVALLALWWWVSRTSGLRHVAAAAVGGVVGFSPWIIYNITHNWWGLGRFADAVNKSPDAGSRIVAAVKRFGMLLIDDIPAGLSFHAGTLAGTKALSYLYYVLLLALTVTLVVLLRRRWRDGWRALWPTKPRAVSDAALWSLAPVGFVLLYSLVYSVSDYDLFARQWGTLDAEPYCHIFALYPMLLLSAGLAVGHAWRTRLRWPAATVAAVLAIMGVVAIGGLLTPNRPQHERLRRPAYDMGVIYMEIGSKWGADHAQLTKIQRRLDGQALRSFIHGAGIKYGLDHPTSLPVALDKCAAQSDALVPYCLIGVGTGLYVGDAYLHLPQRNEVLRGSPAAARPWLTLGACVGNIWTGRADHWSCGLASAIDVAALAPEGEKDDLPGFVSGHLAMLQFRPQKE